MKKFKYKFTIFTPCYNSSKFIHRVFETLDSQTYRDFEWIVINDASTDNTSELIAEYIKTVDFPVKFFDLKENQMLAANYNLAFKNSEGELFMATGHDDIYMPDILENYAKLYDKYNSQNIAGLVGRCITQYGKITPKEFTKPIMNYWEYGVDENGEGTGEAPRVFKSEIFAKYLPYDEKMKIQPLIEGIIGCDGYDMITTNNIVRKYFVNEGEHSLCHNIGKYAYGNWRCTLMEINKFQEFRHPSTRNKIRTYVYYGYTALKAEIPFKTSIGELKRAKLQIILAYPIGLLLKQMVRFDKIHKVINKLIQ